MTESRFGIRPFPRVATYPTSWNGEMTFEQISEDIRPRAAKMLLRQYHVWAQDLDDCLQNGLIPPTIQPCRQLWTGLRAALPSGLIRRMAGSPRFGGSPPGARITRLSPMV